MTDTPTTQGRAALLENATLIISQGAENSYGWTWERRVAPATEYTPVDLTGWTARAQIRTNVGGEIWATFTDTDGITLDDQGNITLTVGHAVTEAAEWQTLARVEGVWDLELIDGDGEVTRFAMGPVIVSQDVTRDA